MSLDPNISVVLTDIILEVDPEIFVVELELHRSKNSVLRILIDKDEGISLDTCRKVNKKIGRYLEEEEIFDFRYFLEVGSPGVGRPLKINRQYHQNVGRNLKIKLFDGQIVKGKLVAVEEEQIFLEPEKSGKKKKHNGSALLTDGESTNIKFEDIQEAKVLVSFK